MDYKNDKIAMWFDRHLTGIGACGIVLLTVLVVFMQGRIDWTNGPVLLMQAMFAYRMVWPNTLPNEVPWSLPDTIDVILYVGLAVLMIVEWIQVAALRDRIIWLVLAVLYVAVTVHYQRKCKRRWLRT